MHEKLNTLARQFRRRGLHKEAGILDTIKDKFKSFTDKFKKDPQIEAQIQKQIADLLEKTKDNITNSLEETADSFSNKAHEAASKSQSQTQPEPREYMRGQSKAFSEFTNMLEGLVSQSVGGQP